ncbi:MAG: acyloxyacyl hydrolase [Gammaproteobacteria bacterium]
MKKPFPLSRPDAVLFALALGGVASVAHADAPVHPADRWEVAFEAGYLKKVRNNSSLDYVIAPAQLAWRSPAMFDLWQGASGSRLTVRNRVAVVYETYVKGGEDYYLAFAGAPTFELWAANQRSALFFEIGGGAGLTNAGNTPGGQGQDFTFNWFSQLGVRHQFNKNQAFTAAGYFTHHSNLGMTDPNPGIDVLGVNLGLIWQY